MALIPFSKKTPGAITKLDSEKLQPVSVGSGLPAMHLTNSNIYSNYGIDYGIDGTHYTGTFTNDDAHKKETIIGRLLTYKQWHSEDMYGGVRMVVVAIEVDKLGGWKAYCIDEKKMASTNGMIEIDKHTSYCIKEWEIASAIFPELDSQLYLLS